AIAAHGELTRALPDRDALRQLERERALAALHFAVPTLQAHGDALGQHDGALAHARLALGDGAPFGSCGSHHHTSHRSSPPTLRRRASLSVISPWDVLRIEVPSPLSTRGMWS